MPTVVSLALVMDTVQTIVSKWKIALIGQQQLRGTTGQMIHHNYVYYIIDLSMNTVNILYISLPGISTCLKG